MFTILSSFCFLVSTLQSLKQRLGKSNIQARLGRPIGLLMRGGAGGRGFGVTGMRGATRGLRGRGRGGAMRGALALRGAAKRITAVIAHKFCYYS